MKKDSDAAWYAREMVNILVMMALFNFGYWLPSFGEPIGIEDIDLARRVVGVLLGVYFIVDGNRTPKMMLVPASYFAAAPTQRLLRVTGWTWVAIGAAYALVWLMLPIDLADPISAILIFSGFLLFCVQFFLSARQARQLKGEAS